MNNKTKIIAILGFWLFIAFALVLFHEKVFLTGQTIGLKVHPIDPSDLLRGQYVRLEYDISKIPVRKIEGFKVKGGDNVYITLKAASDGVYTVKSVHTTRPKKDELYIAGKVRYVGWNSKLGKDYRDLNINYGIENYFTNQKEAKRLEKELAKNGGIATIVLDKRGNARIINVK